MNLGISFSGGLTNLQAAVQQMAARINVVWKKQHANDGSHAAITGTSLTVTGPIAGGALIGGPVRAEGNIAAMPTPAAVGPSGTPRRMLDLGVTTAGVLSLWFRRSPGDPPLADNNEVTSGQILASSLAVRGAGASHVTFAGGMISNQLAGGMDAATLSGRVEIKDGILDLGQAIGGQGQIAFPFTAVPSSDPNTLDDYREGTFLPVLSFGGASVGITYSVRSGWYVKVGRMATVSIFVTLSNKGSSVGGAKILNMPVALASGSIVLAPMFLTGGPAPAAPPPIALVSAAQADFYTSAVGPITDAGFANTSTFYFTYTGIAAA